MAVVDYGSIVKGALKSFNEVDQYIQAEEEREYQKAKERRDHLYKSDRDKMGDFWRDYQQQYKEYRDRVQDEFNAQKFEETKRQHNDNVALKNKQLDAQQNQWEQEHDLKQKQFKFGALKDIANIESKVAEKKGEQVYKGVNGSTSSRSGSGSLSWVTKINKENASMVDTILNNHDSPEQQKIQVQEFGRTLPEDQREYVARYYEHKTGLTNETTLTGMKNLSNTFYNVGANAVKDGKTATQENIAQDFVNFANENNQEDIENALGRTVDVAMSGTGKIVVNGKEVIVGEVGGHVPGSLRFYHIPNMATVGIVGDFIVDGNVMSNVIVTTTNGQPLAYDERTLKAMRSHTLQSQVNNIIQNRPKLLSEKDYNQIHKDDENKDYNNYLLANARSIQTYNKDPNIVTLKDANAQNYEINQAIQQSQEKPGTSAVYGIYKDRYNGERVGNKVLIEGGIIEVPITEEEDQILKSYKEQADKILSQQLNEDDIAKVQKTQDLSRADAIKYLQDKASQENFNKHFNPIHKKMATVDAITKGFQGDFYDNGFDVITRDLQGDYAFVNEKANKVISVEEYHKLPKEEKDKYEKTSIRNDEDRLNVALMQYVPNEDNRKSFVKQYKDFIKERNEHRQTAGGLYGAYVRNFLKTKISDGDKSLPKEKLEEMYRIIERYKDSPLNDDNDGGGEENKEKLLSELKDAGLSGTFMYGVIKELETDNNKGVNSYNEKRYSYTKAYKPKKKSIQKLSDATSKQQNPNNNGGGYQSTSTSVGGVIKGNKYESDWDRTDNAIYNMRKLVGLNDLNQ